MLDAMYQKGQELLCDEIARKCPSLLLNHLQGLLQGNATQIGKEATSFCFEAAKECSTVWLNQYAVPVVATAVVATTLAVACCTRPRR